MEVKEGELSAIQIVLRLPKSTYATMAIRELLHIPSSFECQKTLNKMYEKDKEEAKNEWMIIEKHKFIEFFLKKQTNNTIIESIHSQYIDYPL